MRAKRLTALLMALCLLLCAPAARAEAAARGRYGEGDTMEYVGGGLLARRPSRARLVQDELTFAYLDFDMSYLVTGQSATWRVTAQGASGEYEYEFDIFYREGGSGKLLWQAGRPASPDNTYAYTTPHTKGQYMLIINVYDASGESLEWQSQIFEVAGQSQFEDETTVPGKVRALARRCLSEAGSSDYARALWLHDWLTHNANYDYTYQYYYANGVLLLGKGVCQSYALAYDMLLKAVNIPCVYITGIAGDFSEIGGTSPHAWNLVQLSGEWYHVDCTWDDPGSGGYETHEYFGLTDAMIAKDHEWTYGSGVMPPCEHTEYCKPLRAGCAMVSGEAALIAALNDAVRAQTPYIEILSASADDSFSVYTAVRAWIDAFGTNRPFNSIKYSLGKSGGSILFDFGSGYADTTKALSVRLDASALILNPGEAYTLCADTLPSGVGNAGITWSSSRPGVATCENGRIRAVSPGIAIITATCANGSAASVRVQVPSTDRVYVPEGVTRVEAQTFAGCAELQTVILPETVTYIGEGAFSGCEGLIKVVVPAARIEIAATAFENSPYVVLYCAENSDAHSFATANGLETAPLEGQ